MSLPVPVSLPDELNDLFNNCTCKGKVNNKCGIYYLYKYESKYSYNITYNYWRIMDKQVSFEYILDNVDEDIQIKLLFHLDFFMRSYLDE
jgi:hypothetical protein